MEHCDVENHLKLVLFSFRVVSMEENEEDILFQYVYKNIWIFLV